MNKNNNNIEIVYKISIIKIWILFSVFLCQVRTAQGSLDSDLLNNEKPPLSKEINFTKQALKICAEIYNEEISKSSMNFTAEREDHRSNFINCLIQQTEEPLKAIPIRSENFSSYRREKTEKLKQDHYNTHFEFKANLSGDKQSDFEFDAVIPILISPEKDRSLFLQPGFVFSLQRSSKTQDGASVGLVYRFAVSEGVIGVNVFHDYNFVRDRIFNYKASHNRISLGLDYQRKDSYLSLNFYQPILTEDLDWILNDQGQKFRESGADVYDLFFRQNISDTLDLTTRLSHSEKEHADQSFEDRLNVSAGVDYYINCHAEISFHLTHDFEKDKTVPWLGLVFHFGPGNAAKNCLKKSVQKTSKLFTIAQRKKKIQLNREVRSPPIILPITVLPENTEELFQILEGGDINSDTVWIFEQGGPKHEFVNEDVLLQFPNHEDKLLVQSHQVLTYNNDLSQEDLTIEQLRVENEVNSEILHRVINHFKSQGKEVVVFGHSYGAMTVTHYLAHKGMEASADAYVIMASRLDAERKLYENLQQGIFLTFPDYRNPEIYTTQPVNNQQRTELRLVGVISEYRYTEELRGRDLSNVIYVHGKHDEAVGALTDHEIQFLNSHGAQVIAVEEDGHHGSMIDREDIRMEISEALEELL